MSKFLDENGLQYFWSKLKTSLSNKVDKITGKGLSTEDYTTEEKTKLAGIPDVDAVPIENSENLITSGGVYSALKNAGITGKFSNFSNWGTFNANAAHLATTTVTLIEPVDRTKIYLMVTSYNNVGPTIHPILFNSFESVNGKCVPVFDRYTATFKCSIVPTGVSSDQLSITFTLYTNDRNPLQSPVAFRVYAVN